MYIQGLQKLTLLDYPEKLACTVFTAGCNFRCPFCHNASLVRGTGEEPMAEEDFFAFLQSRRGILEGVCVTGGEPTLQPDLPAFLARIKELGFAVKLDTNGYRPAVLKQLVEAGLIDYVAMDIKNTPEKYPLTAGVEGLEVEHVRESVAFLLTGAVDYEFRTTVVKELHTAADIEGICRWIRGAKRYYLQNFEDSGDLLSEGFSGCDKETLAAYLNLSKNILGQVELRGVTAIS